MSQASISSRPSAPARPITRSQAPKTAASEVASSTRNPRIRLEGRVDHPEDDIPVSDDEIPSRRRAGRPRGSGSRQRGRASAITSTPSISRSRAASGSARIGETSVEVSPTTPAARAISSSRITQVAALTKTPALVSLFIILTRGLFINLFRPLPNARCASFKTTFAGSKAGISHASLAKGIRRASVRSSCPLLLVSTRGKSSLVYCNPLPMVSVSFISFSLKLTLFNS